MALMVAPSLPAISETPGSRDISSSWSKAAPSIQA
ncbi:hypothetical protein GGI59_001048 [Rhizobium lentis]|uniref:Uncharacterized protein n=1 Tax=Rhizobium lentis TaxID=1138194 RepID=A0A7W8UK03_9HYPH|nr:hypothetical protein [Rhizobium lentis]MBB5548888.1 hypothetical protein [Rhizobium lentis]MBB5559421.1 hypothetical protein [Rhizobium lentis]MBB5565057.1 hypothetical protein [Rhizobium lentis]